MQPMMKNFFSNSLYFTIAFFCVLAIDIFVKITVNYFPFRHFTKALIVGSLIIYFLYNKPKSSKKNLEFDRLFHNQFRK